MEISTIKTSRRHRSVAWMVAAVIIAGLSGFGIYAAADGPAASAEASAEEPVVVTPIGETGFSKIVLSESAVKRLDLKTALAVNASVGGKQRIVVPYASVLYDPDGTTWVYKSTALRTFVRHPITVDYVAGARALLTKGPAAGTRVATVGAQELFGAEHGVGASSGH